LTYLIKTVLQKAFDSFAQGKGYITPEMVGTILRVMGQAFNEQTLRELISEVDEDGWIE
jgi:Ca2+-binding EF-hand superfamily protein